MHYLVVTHDVKLEADVKEMMPTVKYMYIACQQQ
jgi:hypothetical protein